MRRDSLPLPDSTLRPASRWWALLAVLLALMSGCGGQTTPGDLPPTLYSSTDPGDTAPQTPATVDFGTDLRLLAFDLHQTDAGAVLVTYWTALRPLAGKQPFPWPFFYDEATGDLISPRPTWPVGTAEAPWPAPGHVVRLALPPLALGQRTEAGVGVAVLADPADPASRLPATPGASTVVLRLLDEGRTVTLARLRGGRPDLETRRFEPPPTLQHPVATTFGGVAALRGYELARVATEEGGQALLVTLHWEALQPTDENFTVRAELLGPDDAPLSAAESLPRVGLRPTTSWLAGEWITDSYRLPIPTGSRPATLAIALQDSSGQTLTCAGDGASGSRAEFALAGLP